MLSSFMLAGPESDKAGPLGLLTIIALGVAVYFLYRSMVKHVKKVPASFDPPQGTQRTGGPDGGGSQGDGPDSDGPERAGPDRT